MKFKLLRWNGGWLIPVSDLTCAPWEVFHHFEAQNLDDAINYVIQIHKAKYVDHAKYDDLPNLAFMSFVGAKNYRNNILVIAEESYATT